MLRKSLLIVIKACWSHSICKIQVALPGLIKRVVFSLFCQNPFDLILRIELLNWELICLTKSWISRCKIYIVPLTIKIITSDSVSSSWPQPRTWRSVKLSLQHMAHHHLLTATWQSLLILTNLQHPHKSVTTEPAQL